MDPKEIPYSLSIRLLDAGPPVAARVEEGRGIAEVVRRDLLRYYGMVEEALARIRRQFSREELLLVLDACNGSLFSPDGLNMSTRLLWAEVSDAIRLDGLDRKWEVADPQGLVERLRGLSHGDLLALVDAVERFWAHCELETNEALRLAGLLDPIRP